MQVIILGIGSPLVVPDRAGPATLVRIGRMDLLFDCGRAVLMRISSRLPKPLPPVVFHSWC